MVLLIVCMPGKTLPGTYDTKANVPRDVHFIGAMFGCCRHPLTAPSRLKGQMEKL